MSGIKALNGLRILDFTWYGAGPTGTKWLADNGAQIIRVESQQRVDGFRPQEPKVGDPASPNASLYFNNLNTNKLGILLDLNNPKGLELARQLVKISDAVMTNFSPRAIDKWSLSYEALKEIKEDIIVIHMPAMGMTGPKRHYAGFGPGFKAIGGLNMLMGYEGTPPVGPQGSYTDFCLVPSHCMTALLAALHYRKRSGRGQFIDFSQYECVINATGPSILEYTVNGRLLPRIGNRHPSMAPHGHYPCIGEDSNVVIAVEDDEQWDALCAVAEKPEWFEDSRFLTAAGRLEHMDELDRMVADWTKDHYAYDVMLQLQQAGVAAGVVQTSEDLFEHDFQLKAREHYVWVDHPETGPQPADQVAFRFSSLDTRPDRPAPCMGEHNDFVFQELLGLSMDEMNELIIENVLY